MPDQPGSAAGNWGIKEAWPYIEEILTGGDIDKPLLIAAIDASMQINPSESEDILSDLSLSDDEEIAAAAEEALAMAGMYDDDLSDSDDFPDEDLY